MTLPKPVRAIHWRTRAACQWLALAVVAGTACSGTDATQIFGTDGSGLSARGTARADINEASPGGETTNTFLFGPSAFIPAASNITRENQRLFATGNGFFNQAWITAPASNDSRDGLGPLFNARACADCHFKDGRGRPPVVEGEGFVSMLLRLSVPGERGGAPVPEPNYGGQLQPFGVNGVPGEGTPRVLYRSITGEYADGEQYELLEPTYLIEEPAHGPLHSDLLVSPRVAPAMIGLGLLEAIDEARLMELTDPDDANADGVSGRVNRVQDIATNSVTVGRFGWKAEQPSVKQQSAGAFLGDIGVTSSLFPMRECSGTQLQCQAAASGGEPEISDRLLERVARYAELLAVPARLEYTEPGVLRGKARFDELECDACHVPSHRTAPDAELEELRDQLIWPYTDLLLHDMGEGLSDHRPSAEAEGNEWRTPPLWGLGLYPSVNGHDRLLHDGRARGVAEAVLWHGGEGAAAREAFVQLSADERADLVTFVESL
jgi:CxxC motif-containing protein (DUF1111 family)